MNTLAPSFVYPPANCVCGWVYCFHVRLSIPPSIRPSVRPKRFVSLISLRVIDGVSSNLAYLFMSTGPILIIKLYWLGAISMRVISLCISKKLVYMHK